MHNVGGLIRTDACVCIDRLKLRFDTTKCVSVIWNHSAASKLKLGVAPREYPRHADTRRNHSLPVSTRVAGEESETSVRQISVVLYRTRLSSAPSSSPAFI